MLFSALQFAVSHLFKIFIILFFLYSIRCAALLALLDRRLERGVLQ